MAGLIRECVDRRVPQVVTIYAGASWGLVEFSAFLTDEFLLSPHWPRVAMTTLLLLAPMAVMLAWFHGKRGRDEVPLVEKIAIPANLVLALAVLGVLFRGADLGAATTTVFVETEDGEGIERVVPKPEFRKRTALFAFDAGPGLGEDEDWLTYMAPVTLVLDLAADDFFEPVPFDAFIRAFVGARVPHSSGCASIAQARDFAGVSCRFRRRRDGGPGGGPVPDDVHGPRGRAWFAGERDGA